MNPTERRVSTPQERENVAVTVAILKEGQETMHEDLKEIKETIKDLVKQRDLIAEDRERRLQLLACAQHNEAIKANSLAIFEQGKVIAGLQVKAGFFGIVGGMLVYIAAWLRQELGK